MEPRPSLNDHPAPSASVAAVPAETPVAAGAPLPWHTRFALAAMLAGGIVIGWGARGALAPSGVGATPTAAAAALPDGTATAQRVCVPGIGRPVDEAANDLHPCAGGPSNRPGAAPLIPDLTATGAEGVGSRRWPGEPCALSDRAVGGQREAVP